MKTPYLLTHIMSHIHSCIRLYDADYHLTKTISNASSFSDAPYGELIVRHPLIRSYTPSEQPPLLFSVNEALAYAWVPIGDGFCLLGPTRPTEDVTFRHRLRFDEGEADNTHQLKADSIPYCSISVFAEDILLLYHSECQFPEGTSPLGSQQLLASHCTYNQFQRNVLKEFYQTVFENVENRFAHNPYNHEARECACIRRGDVEGLRRVLDERFPGRYGKLAANPVRQAINLGIIAITLASRAAIDGGLHFETSFYLSDVFIQQLETCRDVTTIERLYHNAQVQYAQLVHELLIKKEGDISEMENRHISHCKDYIFAHLHEKLTVKEIAKAIGLDANYLSALFRSCEKVTLKQFILHEKLKLAKNLLAYSDYSYSQIAASLGFSSQSHMGEEFKKVTGMTPKAYRLANSEDDFVQESMELSGSN